MGIQHSLAIKIANAVLFQIGWFFCVLGSSLVAYAATVLCLVAHFILLKNYSDRFPWVLEILWIWAILLIGIVTESIFFSSGILVYEYQSVDSSFIVLPPAWLLCLWLLFATALRLSLAFMLQKMTLAIALGGALTPFSYWSGALLNSQVDLVIPAISSLLYIALAWAIVFLILFYLLRLFGFLEREIRGSKISQSALEQL